MQWYAELASAPSVFPCPRERSLHDVVDFCHSLRLCQRRPRVFQ